MKRLLILVFILIVSISAVSAADNVTDSAISSADDDLVCDDGISNMDGENNPVVSDNLSIQADDFTWYYKANPVYNFKIVDSNGTGVYAENISVTLNNKIQFISSDENGSAKLNINLAAGNYNILIKYANITTVKNINLFSSRVTHSGDISTTFGTKCKYYVKLVDNAGNPMVGYPVKFKVINKVYTIRTNEYGIANFYLNAQAGNHILEFNADGFTGKNRYNVKNKITFQTLKWGLTGDVSKAPLIKKNMPNNYWVKKAVAATKQGLPLLTIKGSNVGKVVFMTAGVHGNELNSQVAAMKMIDYLTTHPIRGTVYIIPFVNVKAISKKVRLTNYDFNRVAHKAGTVSNKITKLIVKYKCDAYGDFHTTVSPGVPGINVVLGYKSPGKCVAMSNFIAKNAKVNKIFYYPGQKYRWSLADWVNYKGTPAVICEVISPVNKVSAKATSLSYNEMSAFLKYNKIF